MASYSGYTVNRPGGPGASSSSAAAPRTKTLNTKELFSNFGNPDPDIRFMSLCDLEEFLANDRFAAHLTNDSYSSEMTSLATHLISLLEDQNGEVQNQALKCFGPLTLRTSPTRKPALLNRLCRLTTKPDTDSSLAFAALRSCIANMRHPSPAGGITNDVADDYRAVRDTLMKWLLGGDNVPNVGIVTSLLSKEKGKAYTSDAIDLARDIVRVYSVLISPADLEKLLVRAMGILCDDAAGSVAVKRALLLVQEMASRFNEAHWDRFIRYLKAGFTRKGVTVNQTKNLISTVGMVCRGEPLKLGNHVPELTDYVLKPISLEETTMGGTDEGEDEHDAQADELKEFALLTMDTLLSSCPQQMEPYLFHCMNAALKYVIYEPNIAGFDAEDEEMQDDDDDDAGFGGSDVDEDEFEDYEAADESDTDDVSWKVRRAAAKTLGTIITMPAASAANAGSSFKDKLIYTQIAPTLLTRLTREKEDAVKVEIVTCLVGLVKRSYKDGALDAATAALADYDDTAVSPLDTSERVRSSKKRRREDDDIDMSTDDVQFDAANDVDYEAQIAACPASFIREASPLGSLPSTAPTREEEQELEKLVSPLVSALVKAWKNASVALRQSSLVLLKAVAVARPGVLMVYLDQIQLPIQEALKSISTSSLGARVDTGVGSASGAVSVAGLCIEGLGLIGVIAATHAHSCPGEEEAIAVSLLSSLEGIIPGIVESVDGKNVKVAIEGLLAIERIAKALTPSQSSKGFNTLRFPTVIVPVIQQLQELFEVVVRKIGDNNADSDVRKRAIHVLGVLLARTTALQGEELLSQTSRAQGLSVLLDRMKSELTRVAAIKAVEEVALSASKPEDMPGPWLLDVTSELANQLRKSDRALRGSSLDALKSIAVNTNTRTHLDASNESVHKLNQSLLQLLSAKDLHMLTPALIIYTKIIPGHVSSVLKNEFVVGMCDVVRMPLSGMTLKAFLLLVRVISEQGAGNIILPAFLKDVGVDGDPGVLGRAIGTILVHGGPEIPVKIQDFSAELNTDDPARRCLALSVLGEVGLRMGSRSELSPEIFLSNFNSSGRVRLSAAVALGNAGANNVRVYLPVILDGLQNSTGLQYLLLHSLKEILHHPAKVREEVRPFAETLWSTLLKASESVDNRVVGAACIGRLALIEPGSYLPRLKEYLYDDDAGIRSTVISAFRYTLAEQSDAYHEVMRPILAPILHAMLEDPDLGNHRLALTTVNTAILHQLDLVKPQLHELVMLIIEDTKVKPELVREVQMGPFKHKVDDGLDLRKAAYEALYTSFEHSLPTLNISAVYVRLLAGISDHGDIRTLCLLMISKLITLRPAETKHHLNSLAEKFNGVLTVKQASNAVKQDLEREQEATSGILRVTKELAKAFPVVESAGEYGPWKNYLEKSKTYKTL